MNTQARLSTTQLHPILGLIFSEESEPYSKENIPLKPLSLCKVYVRSDFQKAKLIFGNVLPCSALAEASVIVREHTPMTNLFMCLWFNEVVRFTSRDQLSFPYVLRRLKMPGLNMFPVCTRKDLVNSMGHKRKVKPLVRTN